MKRILFTLLCITATFHLSQGQNMRYFEFITICGYGNWQDSSFIAATSNQELIDSVLANMTRPIEQRKFIIGPIDFGHGGHNRNATHWFLWHFIPDQWELTEVALEVCDGCPYSDIDADTAYWVGSLGQFCPWTGKPAREVSGPITSVDEHSWVKNVSIFPNPAGNSLQISGYHSNSIYISIFNALGQDCAPVRVLQPQESLDISGLHPGIYYVKMTDLKNFCIRKLVKS